MGDVDQLMQTLTSLVTLPSQLSLRAGGGSVAR